MYSVDFVTCLQICIKQTCTPLAKLKIPPCSDCHGNGVSGVSCLHRPAYPSIFFPLVRNLASSTEVRPYFSKYRHRVSRKYGNHNVNDAS